MCICFFHNIYEITSLFQRELDFEKRQSMESLDQLEDIEEQVSEFIRILSSILDNLNVSNEKN